MKGDILRKDKWEAKSDDGNASARSDTFLSTIGVGEGEATLELLEDSEGRICFDAQAKDGEHEIGVLVPLPKEEADELARWILEEATTDD